MTYAIVLAAGMSTRMKNSNKLLLKAGDKTILELVLDQLIDSKTDKIIVVLGHQKDEVAQILPNDEKILTVLNKDYKKGQLSSIQSGLKMIDSDVDSFMICLGDMPMLKSEDYDYIIDQFNTFAQTEQCPIVRPVYKSNIGHPVIFHQSYAQQILDNKKDKDCRAIIDINRDNFKPVEVKFLNYFFDVDIDMDYQRLLRQI